MSITTPLNLLLADDDWDDCMLFKEALEELPIAAKLTIVHDGVQLMQLLKQNERALPNVLYLDLNMPRKNGFACLAEIKHNKRLSQLPVIIFSTSFNIENVDILYQNGAHYYIRKPAEFSDLKKVILQSLYLISERRQQQPMRKKFVLTPEVL
jgi:CheY-like chemotaxis protein